MMKRNYLTLEERWLLDIEVAKDGGTFITSIPQCEMCKYWIKGNAMKCKKYLDKKPKETLRCKKECPEFKSNNVLEISTNTKKENQLFGGIFGFSVGDALGVPVEFTSREERKQDPVGEMRAYGTYHQYFGTWSDDSSLTFCLMDSLKDGYDLKNIAEKFTQYYYENLWTPFNKVFDIGGTTAKAIECIKAGNNILECGGRHEEDNGNGSLMRILPLAFYLKNKVVEEKLKIIEEISSLTHAHKRSRLACIIYIELAINLIDGNDKLESYENAKRFVNASCKENYSEEFVNFHNILDKDITLLSEEKIISSGYVVHSLEAALWSFLTSETYKDTILKAINLGEDTDTIAAIAGGIAGIYYGIEAIPDSWLQCLVRKKDINNLIIDFSKSLF